ncbi:oxidoreductase [Streptomyces sp. 8L]|uniref:oxidoreductase n=1 Tax=Streptomyces sp. 8L TaxID=2877242 RepID=UPI001CD7BE33|nr:oxidoreductase [Streptomyces sp. 8L]MCA1220789.1 SDR family NAD(P)-dependent oxidoreductase [Streptomyces sp. 8L]
MRTPQQPVDSGFGAASTAEDVIEGIDLTGRTAVVTGGGSGLGVETVRVLRGAGARVVVPARDPDRARAALAPVLAPGGGRAAAAEPLDGVEVAPMDLLDPASVDAFADAFLASGRPLHILVNSAGIMATPLVRDARGYESQFATNHLGHFQLTGRLRPALAAAGGARVVSVSSWGHHYSPVVFDDPHFLHRDYDPWAGYGQSKTANILFAAALDERGRDDGIRAFSLHPGSIQDTNLGRHLTRDQLRAAGVIDENGDAVLDPARNLKTLQQGAATSVWCATSPRLAGLGGVYCENAEVAIVTPEAPSGAWELGDSTSVPGVMPYAIDPGLADRLWTLSEELTDRGRVPR